MLFLHLFCLLGFSSYSYYQRLALIQNLASVIAYRAVHSPTLDPVETMTGPSKEN
jgi:CHASE3 domain sensor protein